ncbi:hypothetical protein JM93_03475 [Roseibium hamelinense]|uniref:Uncharacterized protein n=1 Tax=Roseibium hamelinense TaxID=150831 RepID=A0A562SNR5_9HYPH|nr:hypothetical protein JM93_03475 [Roseibium hamelinense]
MLLGVLIVDGGQIDTPSEQRQHVFEHIVGNVPAMLAQKGDGAAELDSIRMHVDADNEVEPTSPECLVITRAIAVFVASVEQDGTLELMGGLSLVETSLTLPAQRLARIPFDHKQGPFKATNLMKRLNQVIGFLCGGKHLEES